jgi:signal transduction histidine kinase
MISRVLNLLQLGWNKVKGNAKLSFLVIVLFVFPALFVFVLEQFYSVAQANMQTVELSRTATLHDSVGAVLTVVDQARLTDLLSELQVQNRDVTALRVYAPGPDQTYTVVAASDAEESNNTATPVTVLQLGQVTPNQSFTVPLESAGGRLEQSVRYVEFGNQPYYIFSEHSRAQIDSVLLQRKQDAYILLTLIFVFLIGLAYWINRQADWEQRYKKLHGTLQERDLFANMIVHELRTPLTAIKGYSSFLQDSKTLSSEEQRYADTIRESAERLVLLVNDFLEIARIQSGQMKIESATVDVRNSIQLLVDSLKKEAEHKNLHLIYSQASQPQLLKTDQNRLVQVLTNVVSNSIKYTDEGTVEISCVETKTGITIRVQDTGMGIDAEDQKKLFTPFARLGGVEHTTTTGTGLGMWITRQMIQFLEGSISVESIKGVGTHVIMHFEHLSSQD